MSGPGRLILAAWSPGWAKAWRDGEGNDECMDGWMDGWMDGIEQEWRKRATVVVVGGKFATLGPEIACYGSEEDEVVDGCCRH